MDGHTNILAEAIVDGKEEGFDEEWAMEKLCHFHPDHALSKRFRVLLDEICVKKVSDKIAALERNLAKPENAPGACVPLFTTRNQ